MNTILQTPFTLLVIYFKFSPTWIQVGENYSLLFDTNNLQILMFKHTFHSK